MRVPTTSTLAAAALLATTATAADNSTTTCYTGVRAWTVRGTGETLNGTVLATLGRDIAALEPDSYWTELDYPATLDFVSSATQGVTTLASEMQQYYSACPDGKTVLVGYSQGALIVNIVLAGTNLAGGDIPPLISTQIGENVKAIVMYGDPTRAVGQGLNADCYPCTVGTPLGRTGKYLEAMAPYAGRLLEFCNAFDPVCCGDNTGAGVNAAHSSYFTADQTEVALDFVKQKLDLVTGDDGGKNNGTCTKTFGPTSTANSTSAATGGATSSTTSSVSGTATSTATSTSVPAATSPTASPSSTTGAAPAVSTGGAALLASPSAGWIMLVLGFAACSLGFA